MPARAPEGLVAGSLGKSGLGGDQGQQKASSRPARGRGVGSRKPAAGRFPYLAALPVSAIPFKSLQLPRPMEKTGLQIGRQNRLQRSAVLLGSSALRGC